MSTLEQGIKEHLEDTSSISDLVGERIYALNRPDKGNPQYATTIPAITYRQISGPIEMAMDGEASLARKRFEFNVHGESYLNGTDGVKDIATELHRVLLGLDQTIGRNVNAEVQGVLSEDQEDMWDEEADEYRARVDLIIWDGDPTP